MVQASDCRQDRAGPKGALGALCIAAHPHGSQHGGGPGSGLGVGASGAERGWLKVNLRCRPVPAHGADSRPPSSCDPRLSVGTVVAG